MALFYQTLDLLGVMAWPLLLSLTLSLIILIERFATVVLNTPRRETWLHRLNCKDPLNCEALRDELSGRRSLLARGAQMLLRHAEHDKNLREEIAAVWLQKQRRQLTTGLRLLMVIGIVSPMMGLLGTVLGLINMFESIGATEGPVSPALLADGLGLAMYTTAAGLIIALPAIGGAHLLSLWAERQMSRLEHVLNHLNLWLAGVYPSSGKEMRA
ncbi:MotA/TolQ/ExbB proton channel family protein [Ferrimonas lipolytica]|uniref:MotA/TolQ/ExbB proton channel family protein n=1 Tax=Ferrimonas lipolytica TaxID=2724191 RepID=A0A6H1UBK4_9GAMM|nr:MotA/TolQ/ExbB proton channel family protein [Ferrimonas lipolytica]QIZ76218.1 MotA/TolQ/ExbB proton channel family protein [Ferrimonas lipolytica]